MKKGFSLLEVLIGTFIASLLSTVLLYVLSQTTTLQRAVDTRVDVWTAVGIVENQLEKDLMGVFAPFAAFSKPKESKKDEFVAQTSQAVTPVKSEKEQKKLEHVLYVARNEQGIQNFSFITTNMLPKYQYARLHIARVVYSLVPDKDDPRIFSLMRQEGQVLELEEYTKAQSSFTKIELASNIAAMNVRFVIIKPKKDGSGIDFQIFDTWPIPKTDDKKDEQAEETLVPNFIHITLTFWRDIARDRKETITAYIPVVAVSEPFEKKEPENKKVNGSKKGMQQRQPIKNNSQVGGIKKQPQKSQRTTNMNKYGFPVKMVHN